MGRHALGIAAALLTLWGAGFVFEGLDHTQLAETLMGGCLLVAAGVLWVRWWRWP